MAIELFPHNQETYARMTEMFETDNRVGVVQPTGTGKSFLYLKWMEDHPWDSFVVLSPSNEIFTQLKEYARDAGEDELLDFVRMISYQSLLRMTDEEIQWIQASKIILDEFHRTGADQWGPALQKLLAANPQAQVLGASATPIRYLDNYKDMSTELFDQNLAVEMTLGEAIERKILPTPTIVPVWYDTDSLMVLPENDIGNLPKEAEEKLEELKRRLEDSYGADTIFQKRMPHDHGKYIVFCRNKEHLEEMKDTVPDWLSGVNKNVRSYVSISAQEDRNRQLQAFKEDKADDAIKLLFTIDRLNEGLHVKGIDGVIMLRPTSSPIIYLQQMGRALSVGHEKPLIFDMVNNYQSVQTALKNGSTMNVLEKEMREAAEKCGDTEAFQIYEDMISFNSLYAQMEEILYPTNNVIWEKRFNLYLAYRQEFGCEPSAGAIFHGYDIAKWCNNQRTDYNLGLLSDNRMQKLKAADFPFDKFEYEWQRKFALYLAYKREFGQEPVGVCVYQGENLVTWAKRQRKEFKSGNLSSEHLQKLIDANFVFDVYEHNWQHMFNLYLAYKNDFRKEPPWDVIYEGEQLGSWCNSQCKNLKAGILSDEHLQALKQAGFDFDRKNSRKARLEAEWDVELSSYIAHLKEHGCEPPGNWAHKQRQYFERGRLSDSRIQKLIDAGFEFDGRKLMSNLKWERKFRLYLDFKHEFGEEPSTSTSYRGENLGIWIKNQRSDFNNGTLSDEHYNKLLDAGFVFNKRNLANNKEDISQLSNVASHSEPAGIWGNKPQTMQQNNGLVNLIAEADSLRANCPAKGGSGLDGPVGR